MTVITRTEIRARRRINILAGLALAAIAGSLYAVGRFTGNGTIDRLIATI